MTRDDPEYSMTSEDEGCHWLRALLGHPVRCLTCPSPKCYYDMDTEDIVEVERKMRLIDATPSVS